MNGVERVQTGEVRVRLWAIGCFAWSAMACAGQTARTSVPAVGVRGSVVVWWVEPSTAAQRDQYVLEHIVPSVPRLPLDQRTASQLGQNAGDFGQSAGDYGQTASSYGTNASDFGQNAASTGQTASQTGRSASDTGQTAGSYGQTAGSFGQAASTFGVAASDTARLPQPHGPEPITLTAAQQKFLEHLRAGLPGLSVQVVPVLEIALAEKLAAVERTAACPDLVAGAESPALGASARSQVSVADLPLAARPTRGEAPVPASVQQTLTLMRRAPHPAQARALIDFLQRHPQP